MTVVCTGQIVSYGEDDLSEFYKCWDSELGEDSPPDFKAGLLYYKILRQYGDTIVEVYHSSCKCDEDANYSQLDTCVIPEEVIYAGTPYIVKGIGFSAFYGCSKLKKIVLPNSITYIAPTSLNFCDNLMSINIPLSVKRVGPPNWGMNPYIYSVFEHLSDTMYVNDVNIVP